MTKHITEIAADKVESQAIELQGSPKPNKLPGPSTNPATNLIIADIALRAIGRLTRNSLHKGVLRTRYNRDLASEIVENRSIATTLVIYGITKVATRSVPGALLVSAGLIAKTVFDRSQSRSAARAAGDSVMDQFAEEK
ncbi:hypothetical protein BPTFM16_02577 [Altererythrobacter insulae]|nr:hypothetical protein BPTFM16_02577 [Altererythrobacter insulae]